MRLNTLWVQLRASAFFRRNGRRMRWGVIAVVLFVLLVAVLDFLCPLPLAAWDDSGTIVLAADGSPLRAYPTRSGVWRYRVMPQEVAPHYREALLRYEDRWFEWHPGVNPVALGRAAWQWIRHGRIVSGGSTLTMQVARMLDGPAPRTLGSKCRQILRALQLELHFSKQEILTLYLNHAPMGGIVEGVEMASRLYLGKSSSHLTPAEAALLVALPQRPSELRPDRYPVRAQGARDKVLLRMAELGTWSVETVTDARMETVIAQPLRAQWLAPLAADRLRREANAASRQGSGLRTIQSTLDWRWQNTIERLLLDRVDGLPPKVSLAVLVMDNDTLEVRAYAGSADFSDSTRYAHVDMVQAIRSPGSALKPFLYALAFDEGLIHSESLLIDAPQSFSGYAPGNFQANFSGPISVSEALQRSLNVPAVDVLDRLGPQRFTGMLRTGGVRLRFAAGTAPNLSLILGGGGTTLEELVGAYRALARGGLAGQPRLTPNAPKRETRMMSEGAAWIIRSILESGGQPDAPFVEGAQRVAWKTGTSFGFRDAWALGVTDQVTVGVWVGRPDGTPNPGFFGANTAAPLLKDIVAALSLTPLIRPARPASVTPVEICWPLGLAAKNQPPELCHQRRRAWALADAVPPTLTDRVRSGSLRETLWVDSQGRRVLPYCSGPMEQNEIARWPILLEAWLDETMLVRSRPPVWRSDCKPLVQSSIPLKIKGIEPREVLRPVPGKRKLNTVLHALGGQGSIVWLLDNHLVATTSPRQRLPLELDQPGAHVITAIDSEGRYDRVPFTLRSPRTDSVE